MVCLNLDENELVIDFILQCLVFIYVVVKFLKYYCNEFMREKECGCDLLVVGDVCENIVFELFFFVCVDSVEILLIVVDDWEVLFLDYFIECDQKKCVLYLLVQVYLGDVWCGDF